jgi:S1-C subfamily serine protease
MDVKKIFVALMLTSVFGLACCPPQQEMNAVIHAQTTQEQARRDLVNEISGKTVSLVKIDSDGDYATYCAGVWVDTNKIMTALHCILNETDVDKIMCKSKEEEMHFETEVKKFDLRNDLVLLRVTSDTVAPHRIAELANDSWQGQHVNIVGHTGGSPWVYMDGVLSLTRIRVDKEDDSIRYALQISSPIWLGNSGGGAWDDNGRLLGISSTMSQVIPNVGYFIHYRHIKELLEEK